MRFPITAVATVEEARSRIAAGEQFAVVLSDYHLPDGNGLKVLYWWKWHRGIELPFVLMSGSASLEPEPSHEVEFLLKPFEMEDLHARLIRLSMSHDCSERMAAADR